MVSFERQSKMS